MIDTFINFMVSKGWFEEYYLAYYKSVNIKTRYSKFSDYCDIINNTLSWVESNTENIRWDDVHDEWYDFVDGDYSSISIKELEKAMELNRNIMFLYLMQKDS